MYGGMIAVICVVGGCVILIAILVSLAIWSANNSNNFANDFFVTWCVFAGMLGFVAVFGGAIGFPTASGTVQTAIREYNAYIEEYTLIEQLYNDGEDLYQLREDNKVLAIDTNGDMTYKTAGLDLNATSYYYWAYPTYLDYDYWNSWLKDAQTRKEHSKYSRYYKVPVEELNYISEEWFLPRGDA